MGKKLYNNGIEAHMFEEGTQPSDYIYEGMLQQSKDKMHEAFKGRKPWNKGKKEAIKHVYYTDGECNIRIPITEEPPKGFTKGKTKKHWNYTKEAKERQVRKTRQTKLERYGSETYNNPVKNKQTRAEKYGDENYNNREKAKQTCLGKYGVDNPFKSEQIKDKIKEINKKLNGYEYSFQNPEIMNKAKQNSWTEEAREKRVNTCLERYGVECAGTIFGIPDARNSKANLNFEALLKENNIEYQREFALGKYRYDFKVGNKLIEINPTVTHNSTMSIYNSGEPKYKKYHYNKTKNANESNFRCIQVWEWDNLEKIINLLKPRTRIDARDCEVKEIKTSEVRSFINKYHLQGYARSNNAIVLEYNNEIVAVMTFAKPRYNKNYEYELIRYCSKYNIVGGAEKLFKYFTRKYKPNSIISYCDLSKFTGNIYEKLGFTEKSISIGKHWHNTKKNTHITDNLLRQRGFDQLLGNEYGKYGKGTSNRELMLKHNFLEVYDSGQATYVWNN